MDKICSALTINYYAKLIRFLLPICYLVRCLMYTDFASKIWAYC